MSDEKKCPACGSPEPKRHPAIQFEGEIAICSDAWHNHPAKGCYANACPQHGKRRAPPLARKALEETR
jgi:hypothetical protein